MQKYAGDVANFNHKVLGIEPRKKSMLCDEELNITINCLKEEAGELRKAHHEQDFIGAVDACIDSIYFALGALYKMGLTASEISECADAVHTCNMRKRIGVNARRGDGSAVDAVKPKEWVGPEELIAKILGGHQ